MKGPSDQSPPQRLAPWLSVCLGLLASPSAHAQQAPHLSVAQPGGMPGLPIITSIERGTNRTRVTWDGPAGYYQLFQKPDLTAPTWQPVGAPTLARRASVPTTSSSAIFRVGGPAPQYAGAQACAECHRPIFRAEKHTAHTRALDTLTRTGQDKNAQCLPCHTVGFGLPTGFVSVNDFASTNRLAGVQCENCHGPAGHHAANENDFAARPRVELAATVCGGCHDGPQHPTFAEWQTSGHARMNAAALAAMNLSTNRLSHCGRCHSGSVRLSLVKGAPLPVGDANVAITCAVCHDPHAKRVWTNVLTGTVTTNQLRYPLASTNDYFLSPTADFAASYNPSINVCAQCHNHRGASWTNTAAAPHRSPQYNMLLGTVGVLPAGVSRTLPAAHAQMIPNQCVGCHMQREPFRSADQPAHTGHSFSVRQYDTCRDCHPLPEMLLAFTTEAIFTQIQRVKSALDYWARTKAPAPLWNRYAERAWEYTVPGALSAGGPGPDAGEQALIPTRIKKARFNLYIVLNDGSFGAHNAPHSAMLLESALYWIQTELNL